MFNLLLWEIQVYLLSKPLRLATLGTSPFRLNLTHKISNEIDTVEDKKQLNEPLPNDL